MTAIPDAPVVEDYLFADSGSVPNNPSLPVIVYRGVLKTAGDAAASCVALFGRNGWTGAWTNGVYSHHHYHSSAHEVLGITAGWVRVQLGGAAGELVGLRSGDVVVIPAGVAHKSEGASPDLLVVGAYPRGQRPDMLRPGAADYTRALARIAAVPLPAADPLFGPSGPLLQRWRSAQRE